MQVKRFVAANMRSALKMVREEIGPDAVILSNKRVPDGVELLTAVDGDALLQSARAESSTNPFEQATADSPSRPPASAKPSKLELGVERMQREAKQRAAALAKTLSASDQRQLGEMINRKDTKAAGAAIDAGAAMALAEDSVQLNSGAANVKMNSAASSITAASPVSRGDTKVDKPAPIIVAELSKQHDQELSQMRHELQSMRDLLEQQFSTMAWGQYSHQNPEQASLWKRLKRMGLSASLSQQLIKQAQADTDSANNKDAWQQIMASLCSKLPVLKKDLIADGGVFAFVGPTGAGKTTTIGKLAARYVLENGADDVALVTTDTLRIAAHEQLRTFGRILNVPVKVVDKHNSLERVLHSLRHKSLVLVDTAGLNRQDYRVVRQLQNLNELSNRLRTVLVVPATSQAEVIKSAFYNYKTDNLCACVLTKFDEAACVGPVLSLAVEQSLPVAYSTDGQGVPDDIAKAEAVALVRYAIDLAKQVATDDGVMADELAQFSRQQVSAKVMAVAG